MAKRQRHLLEPTKDNTGADLGALVAERDQFLANYYVNEPMYVGRAINPHDTAVYFVGPKGVGKSAVLQMVRLLRESDKERVISISPNNLAFSALTNIDVSNPLLEDTGKNQWLYRSLWDYILALEIITRELKTETAAAGFVRNLFRGQDEINARKLLRMSVSDDGRPHPMSANFLTLISEMQLSVQMSGIKLDGKLKGEGEAKGGQLNFLSLINRVVKGIDALLRHPYWILIDDLDLDWRDTPIQNALIAAMFSSVANFNKPPNLKCIVSIQERIFLSLPLEHRDKFRDAVCEMNWDAESIRSMIERRFKNRFFTKSGVAMWGKVFPENGFDRIWKAITGKPREAIRLASLCIQHARKEGHSCVEPGDMTAAIHKFSSEKIADLGSEWGYRYPALDAVVKHLGGFPKEFQIRALKDAAETLALKVMEDHSLRYTWIGGYGENPAGLAKILLECGVLLYKMSRTDTPQPIPPGFHRDLSIDDFVAIDPIYAPGLGVINA